MKFVKNLLIFLTCFSFMACSVQQKTENLEGSFEESVNSIDTESRIQDSATPEMVKAYIDAFASNYTPINGAYFAIDNTYHLYINNSITFKTRINMHNGFPTELSFHLENVNAVGNEIKQIENTSTSSLFTITSATTANFTLSFTLVDGEKITKESEIEIKDNILYLDKVAIGKKREIEDLEAEWKEEFMKIVKGQQLSFVSTNVFSGDIMYKTYGAVDTDGNYYNKFHKYPFIKMLNSSTALFEDNRRIFIIPGTGNEKVHFYHNSTEYPNLTLEPSRIEMLPPL